MKFFGLFSFSTKPMVSKIKSRKEWEDFAEEIYDKVAEALDRWCWHITGDTPLDCYIAHSDRGLFELAEEFLGMEGITEEDLELLREMPDDIYDKYSEKLQRAIERVIDELGKESEEYEEEY